MFEQYEHHGKLVWTRSTWKGLFKRFCLCYSCEKLNIENSELNCPIAKKLFEVCKDNNLVTAVWECPDFKWKDSETVKADDDWGMD